MFSLTNTFGKVINLFKSKKMSLQQIDSKLTEKSTHILSILKDFSTSKDLEQKLNPYFQYLVFTNDNEFYLGREKYIIRFKNYPWSYVSIFTISHLTHSKESSTGVKENKLDIVLKVNTNGDITLDEESNVFEHHLSLKLFKLIDNK
jgi:hypothetical protein